MRETVREFYSDRTYSDALVIEFAEALKRPAPFVYKLDMSFPLADKFIDCDTYLTKDLKLDLAQRLVKPQHRFQKVKWSIATVNYACARFLEYATEIKADHPWIYNPPMIPTNGDAKPNALRAEFQRDFVEDYGAYTEIVYLLANGNPKEFDNVTEWPLKKFLFWGEYMLRKKRVESIN